MAYIQVRNPNVNIPCQPGWCLNYVQRAFGVGWAGSTAVDGWNRSRKKHAGANFPSGVAVPVWFTMDGVPAGHVVVRMADGSMYSTSHPTSTSPTRHPNMQDLLNYYGGRLHLLGWTEDMNGELIIKEGEMPIPDADNYYWRYGQDLAMRTRGRRLSREEFRKHIVGQSDLRAVEILSDDPEAETAQMWQDVGRTAVKDKWDKQIYSLQDALKQSNAALDAAKKEAQLVPELKKQLEEAQKNAEKALKKSSDIEAQQNAAKAEADNFLTALINAMRKLFNK